MVLLDQNDSLENLSSVIHCSREVFGEKSALICEQLRDGVTMLIDKRLDGVIIGLHFAEEQSDAMATETHSTLLALLER